MNFQQKLEKSIKRNNSLLCIGLDTDIDKIPKHFLKSKDPILAFNRAIIDVTHELVCCYKANIAFYSAAGMKGLEALIKTVKYIHDQYQGIPVILDVKRADIGNTSEQYVKEAFDVIDADAATVNPYLGFDSIEPFLIRKDKGVVVLCRTSNPGASDFQDLKINGVPLYIKIAKKIVSWNKKYGNCLMVVGATLPSQISEIRKIAPDMFFLVPGIGAQKGDLQKTLKAGLRDDKSGLIIHSARSIIYVRSKEDFAETARKQAAKLRDEINRFRKSNFSNTW